MTQKVWFVTGASSGLGRSMTEYVLQQGNKVVATLRNPSDISDLVQKYPSDRLLPVKLDVVSLSDIKDAFANGVEKFGRIDVVYNNAGTGFISEIENTPDEVARRLFDVNFWGSTNVAQETVRVFRDMNRPQGGRLLQVSSSVGISAMGALGFYSATKHAMEGLSQSLAQELDPSWNIKVTLLEFGGFKTRPLAQEGGIPAVPPHPAYAEGPTAATRQYFSSGGPLVNIGDADKAAREVYKIAFDDSVGLRVPLGRDALDLVGKQLDEMKKDFKAAEKWSTDLKLDA